LLHGAEKSQQVAKNLMNIENFCSRLDILPYTEQAAAHARSEGLIVVTNNTREFMRVDGLRVENWIGEV
jgi:tRNA(fMet)-specific endonuclease VapC